MAALWFLISPATGLDNGVARTPPMGWRNWNFFAGSITQELMERQFKAMTVSAPLCVRVRVRVRVRRVFAHVLLPRVLVRFANSRKVFDVACWPSHNAGEDGAMELDACMAALSGHRCGFCLATVGQWQAKSTRAADLPQRTPMSTA